MQRRRYDSDSDDDVDDTDDVKQLLSGEAGEGLPSSSAALVDGNNADDMLAMLDCDTLAACQLTEIRGDMFPESLEAVANVEEEVRPRDAPELMNSTAPRKETSRIAVVGPAANVQVHRHVRKRPRDDHVESDALQNIHDMLKDAAKNPAAYFAADVLNHYRPSPVADRDAALLFDEPSHNDGHMGPSTSSVSWPNRFHIQPGWRWDGVVRGNGVESKFV